jgi:hypothetical protein
VITVQNIWGRSDSGIIIPVGHVSDATVKSRSDYLQIRTRAKEIEQLYAVAKVRLPKISDVGGLVQSAKELWENWFLDNREKISYEVFFRAIHLDRIADAVLPLRGVTNNTDYLRALLSGSLNFFSRESSRAKNIFWELEVWSRLNRRKAEATLTDPPDIVVNYDNFRIGIACKKLYSDRHVQNVLSEAVGQIENDFDFGIVAINLDEFLPENVVLQRDSSDAIAEWLLRINEDFLRKHERHFRKYLAKGRLISAMVSTSVIADVPTERPQFRNTYQWTVWTIPGLDIQYQEAVKRFYGTVMGQPVR